MTWKVKFFWHLLTPSHYAKSQNSITFFEYLCWFLAQNRFDFVSLPWQLHNRYCHILELQSEKQIALQIFFFALDMLSTRRNTIASGWVWKASTNYKCIKFYWSGWFFKWLWGCNTSTKFRCCRILRLWHWNLSLSLCHI